MRSSAFVRCFSLFGAVASCGVVGGCALVGDLPEYGLAPGGAGAAGLSGGASKTGGASGATGAPGVSGSGGASGTAGGSESAGASGAGGEGSGGAASAGTSGSGASGAGGIASAGNAGAAGSAPAGASGMAGFSGNGGEGGDGGSGGSSGAAGAGGALAMPEIVAAEQRDPGTLLLVDQTLYWVNRANGGPGEVRAMPLPGAMPTPFGSGQLLPVITAAKDIAILDQRLFVLRGAGTGEQELLTSYGLDGNDPRVAQGCLDGALAAACTVTSMQRLFSGATRVFFSGVAAGSASSNATYAGTKTCTDEADSCQGISAEASPTRAMATVGDTLYSVDAATPTRVKKIGGLVATTFLETVDPVVDLTADGATVYVLTASGRIFARPAGGGVVATLVSGGAGARPQRIAVAAGFVYWTALGEAAGQGRVARVATGGGTMTVLTGDRQAPFGLAVAASAPQPAVYFTDGSDTVQRVRLP